MRNNILAFGLFLFLVFPVFAQRLTGQIGNSVTRTFITRTEIQAEGSYQLQRSSGISSNWVAVTNFNAVRGSITVEESMAGTRRFYRVQRLTEPAAITTQPSGVTNYYDQDVRLETQVSGSWPLRLQWFRDGAAVAGATSNNLVFKGRVTLSGTYTLAVSNLWGVAVSTPVAVKTFNPVATNLAGRRARFVIEAPGHVLNGQTYTTTFDPIGFYSTTSSNQFLNDSGYWQYQIVDENTGRVGLPGSITYPNGVVTLDFQTFTNGSYRLVVPAGTQSGKFEFLQ